MTRDKLITNDQLEYLDVLHDSFGVLIGRDEYLMSIYSVSKEDADIIIKYWNYTFGNETR